MKTGFSPQTLGQQWAFALITRWLLAWRFPPSFLRLAPVGASVSLQRQPWPGVVQVGWA